MGSGVYPPHTGVVVTERRRWDARGTLTELTADLPSVGDITSGTPRCDETHVVYRGM